MYDLELDLYVGVSTGHGGQLVGQASQRGVVGTLFMAGDVIAERAGTVQGVLPGPGESFTVGAMRISSGPVLW